LKSGGIFLNIEPCHKVVRFETALEFICDIREKCENKRLDFMKEVGKEIESCTVVTRYNNKSYHISSLTFEKSPQSKFTQKDGKEMTFIDYYREKYNEKIQDPNQPLLISVNKRTGESNYLIPELCRMTGLN
jgi:aubergine-like protein